MFPLIKCLVRPGKATSLLYVVMSNIQMKRPFAKKRPCAVEVACPLKKSNCWKEETYKTSTLKTCLFHPCDNCSHVLGQCGAWCEPRRGGGPAAPATCVGQRASSLAWCSMTARRKCCEKRDPSLTCTCFKSISYYKSNRDYIDFSL